MKYPPSTPLHQHCVIATCMHIKQLGGGGHLLLNTVIIIVLIIQGVYTIQGALLSFMCG